MTQATRKRRERVLAALIVTMAYALIVALMTWPAPLHLSQRLIGNNVDNWIFYWNNWWFERAIVSGHGWFFTPYLFFPQGASLVAHASSFLNSLLALALEPLVGPVAAYNLVLLFGLWASGVGMFLLVHDLTRQRLAAFLAGFVFAFAPYHLTQVLAHTHLGSIHWWPFYALFLRRALNGGSVRYALVAGLFAALTLWSGLHLALLLALWTLVYVGWWLIVKRHVWLRLIGLTGAAALSALLLCLPLVLPLLANWSEIAHASIPLVEQTTRQTDMLAYLVPPTYNPLIGAYFVSQYERFVANRSSMPYVGFAVLVLALMALFRRPKEALFWGLSGGLWILLAAGPVLRVNAVLSPHIPLPYRLVGQVFPISTIRAPDRFNLLLTLSLPVLVGLGAAWLYARRRWLLLLLALLIPVEYLCAPLPMWELPSSSPFFDQMAQEEAWYGVVNYPLDYELAKLWLYYQTLHGKPIVQGHVSRYTVENYAFITSQPLLRELYREAEHPPYLPLDAEIGSPSEAGAYVRALGPALRSLNDAGVRYVLLHKPYLGDTSQARFRRVLPAVPVYEDETLAVYDTARPLPAFYDGFPVPLALDVALARFDVQHAAEDTEWRIQIVTRLTAPFAAPLACQIALVGDNGDVLAAPVTFFGELLEEDWQVGDLEVQEFVTALPRELETGAYRWSVACPGGATYTPPDTLQVRAAGRVTYLRRSVDLYYGGVIRLSGYRWRTAGADLQVTLLWEALEEPRTDYKVFVHLLDTAGEIVRQYDAMPCRWQCPTGQWQAGEVVWDQADVSLAGLPPGEYRLAVGLYGAETGKRLPVQGPEGGSYPDARFVLPDIFPISLGAW